MIRIIILLLLFILLINKTEAQEIIYTGKVFDKETNTPVQNISITIYDLKLIIYQTLADSAGIFIIPEVYYKEGSLLIFHGLNYAQLKKKKIWC